MTQPTNLQLIDLLTDVRTFIEFGGGTDERRASLVLSLQEMRSALAAASWKEEQMRRSQPSVSRDVYPLWAEHYELTALDDEFLKEISKDALTYVTNWQRMGAGLGWDTAVRVLALGFRVDAEIRRRAQASIVDSQ